MQGLSANALIAISAAVVLLTFAVADLFLRKPNSRTLFFTLFLACASAHVISTSDLLGDYRRLPPLLLTLASASLYHATCRRRVAWAWLFAAIPAAVQIAIGPTPTEATLDAAQMLSFASATALALAVYFETLRRFEPLFLAAVALGVVPDVHTSFGLLNVLIDPWIPGGMWVGDIIIVYAPIAALGVFMIRRALPVGMLAVLSTAFCIVLAMLLHAANAAVRHGESPMPGPLAAVVASVAYPLRWVAFVAFASAATLRSYPADEPRRRAASRLLTAAVFFAAAAVAIGLSTSIAGGTFGLVEWLALGIAVMLSQGFRNILDQTVHVLYGVALPAASVSTIEPGTRLSGRYRPVRLLGRGGQGRVFLALDEREDRHVAIKELLYTQVTERSALSRVRHPRVLELRDVIDLGGRQGLVMEYAPGGTLSQLLRERGVVKESEALAIILDVLEGLAALHRAGIAHGDLKPSNVLFGADGRAKIADLGSAVAADDDTQPLWGATQGWAAPEHVGNGATFRTDVYQAGLLLRALAEDTPRLRDVLGSALHPDPMARFPTADAMRHALVPHASR